MAKKASEEWRRAPLADAFEGEARRAVATIMTLTTAYHKEIGKQVELLNSLWKKQYPNGLNGKFARFNAPNGILLWKFVSMRPIETIANNNVVNPFRL